MTAWLLGCSLALGSYGTAVQIPVGGEKFSFFWLEWHSYDCRLPLNSFMVVQTNNMITITLYVKAKRKKETVAGPY